MSDDVLQRAFIVDDAVLRKYNKGRRRRSGSTSGTKSTRRSSTAIRDCSVCQLDQGVHSPKMEPYGKGHLGIAYVGESPGQTEDRKGIPFVGESGRLLRRVNRDDFGIDLDRDCIRTNAFQCMTTVKKTPTKLRFWTDCCQSRLEKQLTEFQPKLIIALGADAMRAVLRPSFEDPAANRYRGLVFPSPKYNCWVGCCWHPSYILRDNEDLEDMWVDDIATALEYLDRPIPPLLSSDYIVLDDLKKVKDFYAEAKAGKTPMAFDYETNTLKLYNNNAKLHCCSFSDDINQGYFLPLQYKDFWTEDELVEVMAEHAEWLACKRPKVVQNLSMEHSWSVEFFHQEPVNVVDDTMLNHHVIYNRRKTCGLDFQAFLLRGADYKNTIDVKKEGWADKEPVEKVMKYSSLDPQYTLLCHQDQMEKLEKLPEVRNASGFFLKCLPALVRMEMRGTGIDWALLAKQRSDAETTQKECEEYFERSGFVERFREKQGREKWGPGSDKDFRDMFYGTLDLKPPPWRTPKGQLPADKDAVAYIVENASEDEALKKFCNRMMTWRKLDTLLSTFIGGLENARQDDGLVHPSFLLHTVSSYRSSSADPNFQNQPKRDDAHAEFRKVFVPHIGDLLGETDASGSEVATIAMLSGDPVLTKQIQDRFDPHTFWAAKIFDVREQDVTKTQRFFGKNKVVFPWFYGSYYKSVARDCGVPERHAKKVEEEFWRMYKVAKRWQESVVRFYQKHGYITMPMGFRRYGPLSKNQILNTGVQGTSFHMLLEAIYRIDQEMQKKQMKSALIIEVHDSAVTDMVEEEQEDVQKIQVKAMSEKQFGWQGEVPRRCEYFIGPNWGEQNEVNVSYLT